MSVFCKFTTLVLNTDKHICGFDYGGLMFLKVFSTWKENAAIFGLLPLFRLKPAFDRHTLKIWIQVNPRERLVITVNHLDLYRKTSPAC